MVLAATPASPAGLSQRLEQLAEMYCRLALERASAWVLPTLHQAQSLPLEFRESLNVIHEGIDTGWQFLILPLISGFEVSVSMRHSVLTFVTRNLSVYVVLMFLCDLPSLMNEYPDLQ